MLNKFKKIFFYIFIFRQYTNSLQCVHEILYSCNGNETAHTVRKYLRQPWAHKYNTFCDINRQNSTFIVQNNSSETPRDTNSKYRSNLVKYDSRENRQNTSSDQIPNGLHSTINSLPNTTSEIKRTLKSHEEKTYLNTNNNHFISEKRGNQLKTEQTGNDARIFPKSTLFFLKSTKTSNRFQGKGVGKEENGNSERKVEIMEMKILSQNTAVVDYDDHKTTSRSKFEVQFEIH